MVAGMAGSGKGRICEYIAQRNKLQYLSMSTVVHAAMGTPLGSKAIARLKAKQAIEDETIVHLLTDHLKRMPVLDSRESRPQALMHRCFPVCT